MTTSLATLLPSEFTTTLSETLTSSLLEGRALGEHVICPSGTDAYTNNLGTWCCPGTVLGKPEDAYCCVGADAGTTSPSASQACATTVSLFDPDYDAKINALAGNAVDGGGDRASGGTPVLTSLPVVVFTPSATVVGTASPGQTIQLGSLGPPSSASPSGIAMVTLTPTGDGGAQQVMSGAYVAGAIVAAAGLWLMV
ncbi:hypothetical protein F4780DRAFT_699022 [Xylariomycetidae sp. FL0641]|nr:hypothetical protein F4780DRAFT_699022 [Xylariomycetidae sp. FL0641]